MPDTNSFCIKVKMEQMAHCPHFIAHYSVDHGKHYQTILLWKNSHGGDTGNFFLSMAKPIFLHFPLVWYQADSHFLFFFCYWTRVNKTETSPNVITCVLVKYKKSEFAQRNEHDCVCTAYRPTTKRPTIIPFQPFVWSHVFWARIQLCWHHYSISCIVFVCIDSDMGLGKMPFSFYISALLSL